MTTWTVDYHAAKASLRHWMNRVISGDRVIITLDMRGQAEPLAVLISPEEYRQGRDCTEDDIQREPGTQ